MNEAPIARTDAAWPPLKRALKAEVERLRDELEQPQRLLAEGDMIRGEIRFIRRFIEAVEPPVSIPHSAPHVPGTGY